MTPQGPSPRRSSAEARSAQGRRTSGRGALVVTLIAGSAALLDGCAAPAVIAVGAGAGALVATDRRTTGSMVDDEAIENKIALSAQTTWGTSVHLNVTSYNGNVLLTGEAPTLEIKNEIFRIAKTTERVKSVTDEMSVGPVTELSVRTNDTYLTSAVKSRFVEANKFAATHVKVVTERSVVYLLGIVSRQEGDAAAQIAATTAGVSRVVKLFQYTS
jgi:osmotically-inducible protein OsmY